VNLVIIIAGIAGLAVAGYAFLALVRDSLRSRHYVDIVIGALVAAAVVYALVFYGDRLIR
jgi:hypothetical protein